MSGPAPATSVRERLASAFARALPRGIPLPPEIWSKRHRALLVIVWLHVALLPFFSLVRGHGLAHGFFEVTLIAAAGIVGSQSKASRSLRMAAVTVGLVTSSAVLVHLSGGLIEAHFHFFVIVAAITLYQAWLPFLLSIGFVVLHHGIAGALDPASVFNHTAAVNHPWKWAAIHGFFIACASAAGLTAWRLNEDAQMRLTETYEAQRDKDRTHIEQQAEAQAALERSEERFRSLVQNSFEVVVVVRKDSTIDYISPSIESMLGYSPLEMLGRKGFDWVHPEDLQDVMRHFEEIATRGQDDPISFEVRARHRDYSWRWLEVTIHNLNENPAVSGIVVHQRDITDRKLAEKARERLEGQLRQSQKLEAVGQLAGGVAHDFNNLLSVIQNYARFVLDSLEKGDERREDLQEILGAGDRASNLVRQLLTFSRKDIIRPEMCDLNEIVTDMGKMLTRAIPENVTLSVLTYDEPVPVHVDRGQMDQVIMNICVNARDAMSTGGDLSIAVEPVTVPDGGVAGATMIPAGEYAHLSITDTGVGMDSETAGRVFEPFFTTKARDSGTGLGLATVYGIVEHANGRIFVSSEVDVGTTFDIYLPLAAGHARPTLVGPIEEPPRTGVETILVAEDEPAVRHVVTRILTSAGYRVLSANSGPEALEIVRTTEWPIDLLLTDLVMPQMSGVELAAALSDIRSIYMSGYSGDVLTNQGVPDESGYIQKPFTKEALLSKVREALDARTKERFPHRLTG